HADPDAGGMVAAADAALGPPGACHRATALRRPRRHRLRAPGSHRDLSHRILPAVPRARAPRVAVAVSSPPPRPWLDGAARQRAARRADPRALRPGVPARAARPRQLPLADAERPAVPRAAELPAARAARRPRVAA